MQVLRRRPQVTDRWGFVLFAGAGQVAGDFSDLGSESTVWAAGGGFRYTLAKKYGMQAGIDAAYSDGTTTFYITIGSAWAR
ncbi:MAG: hypothetical protein ACYTGN_02755 [Planctomycetota bacterium]|jgi:hypothetical protein